MIYLIGSLRNPCIPALANVLRRQGLDVFDDWYSPGPEADDRWQAYEKERGRSYVEALNGVHAEHVFRFDYEHLCRATAVVLMLPAGKSAHLELGWVLGRGKPGYILLEPDHAEGRFDVMYKFATGVFDSITSLIDTLVELRVDQERGRTA